MREKVQATGIKDEIKTAMKEYILSSQQKPRIKGLGPREENLVFASNIITQVDGLQGKSVYVGIKAILDDVSSKLAAKNSTGKFARTLKSLSEKLNEKIAIYAELNQKVQSTQADIPNLQREIAYLATVDQAIFDSKSSALTQKEFVTEHMDGFKMYYEANYGEMKLTDKQSSSFEERLAGLFSRISTINEKYPHETEKQLEEMRSQIKEQKTELSSRLSDYLNTKNLLDHIKEIDGLTTPRSSAVSVLLSKGQPLQDRFPALQRTLPNARPRNIGGLESKEEPTNASIITPSKDYLQSSTGSGSPTFFGQRRAGEPFPIPSPTNSTPSHSSGDSVSSTDEEASLSPSRSRSESTDSDKLFMLP